MPEQKEHSATLRAWIDEANTEKAKLDEWIAWCERGMELHGDEQTTAPKPRPAEKPKRPTLPTEARAGARDHEAKVLAVVVQSNRPVANSDIVGTTGLSEDMVRRTLGRLVAADKIIRTGAARGTRYHPADHKPHSERRAKVDASTERNANQLQDKVALIGLRDRALKAVLADPGKLTTADIAQALNANEADTTTVLEQLAAQGKIAPGIQRRWARTAAAA